MAKRTCDIDGCEGQHKARGLCNTHYRRWLAHGDPNGGRAIKGEALAYLYKHVTVETDDCILWPYGISSSGYGQVVESGVKINAHVLACRIAHGLCPPNHEVCHSCRNRHCFNPRHVRWGTRAENAADKLRDGTHNRGERHPATRLTETDIRTIRQEHNRGVRYRELADMYGVARVTIGQIVRRDRWGWLD